MKKWICIVGVLIEFILVSSLISVKAEPSVKRKAFINQHSHYDPVWTNTQAGETLRAFAVVNEQLEYAEIEPKFKFMLQEIDYLKPYWDAFPMKRALILNLAREGRLEFTSGYNEPDESETGGEALIRNFAYGKLFKESQYGAEVLTATQHDVFGHAEQLPQILLGTGHKYAVFSRGTLPELTEFNWLSPDGSSILTKQATYVNSASRASFFSNDPKYYGLTNNAMFISGGDFEEPDRSIGQRLGKKGNSSIISATHIEFFQAVENDLKEMGKPAPEISRDQNPIFNGCYTSRIDTKLANRMGENLLVDAEKFGTINSILSGAAYPWLEFDRAWRLLFFGEHHDGLTGTDNENVNLDLLTGWREALVIAKNSLDVSLAGIAKRINTAKTAPKNGAVVPIVIFNSLNWLRSEPVETTVEFSKPVKAFRIIDSDGKPVSFQLLSQASNASFKNARVLIEALIVPPVGYRVLYAVGDEKFPEGAIPSKAAGDTIDNSFYRIIVNPMRGGGIESIFAKKLNKEFINTKNGVGNEIYAIMEVTGSSPWSLNGNGNYWRSGIYPAKSVEVERGAVCDKIIVTNNPRREKIHRNSSEEDEVLPEIVSEIIIYKSNKRIDFRTFINGYKGKDFLYKVGFPANITNGAPVFNERFATITRDKSPSVFLSTNENGATPGREYPIYNWHGISPAASFTFEDAGGKVVSQFPLVNGELVAQMQNYEMVRAVNSLSGALARVGVTTTPASDKSPRAGESYGFRISLGYGMNNEYTNMLLAGIDAEKKAKFENEIVSDGVGFLFVENKESVSTSMDRRSIPILIIEGETKETLDNALENISALLRKRGEVVMAKSANATSFQNPMDGFGLALINNGNPGASVERDGTITLSLMRSSTGSPAGESYSSIWETENWNHRYRYALLPHKGKWSDAGSGVDRAGYGFNFPLIAIQTDIHTGELHANLDSFMDTGNADVIISSFKPAGYPAAEGIDDIAGGKEISLRFYNSGISETAGKVTLNFPVDKVEEADMLDRAVKTVENSGGIFPVAFSQFKINTYIVGLKSDKNFFEPAKPAPAAQAPPVNSRYWETNGNAAPEGMVPVSVIIEPNGYSDAGRTLNVRVTLAGNLKNRSVSGELKFDLPVGASIKGETKYKLAPSEIKTFDLRVEGLDPQRLRKNYISVCIAIDGREYEDVLTFSEWKMMEGDVGDGADPEASDSGWKTVPLARFWSAFDSNSETTWYRKKIFVPKGMSDVQMLFERPKDSEIEVYINGNLVRKEKWGLSYKPLIDKKLMKIGGENLVAIKFMRGKGDSPAWSSSFKGSEALFNKENARLISDSLNVKPGTKGVFKVEMTNPFEQEMKGEAILVSPIETWKEGGAYSLIDIGPRTQVFSVKPGGKTIVEFEANVPNDAMAGTHVAAVKLIYKGIATYTDTIKIIVDR
ncbi:MAG: glycoside hydrolase family 38 C-terminal domain-containing protein [bacterium]